VEFSTDLKTWEFHSGLIESSPNQTNVPARLTWLRIAHPAGESKYF
jgi:hypothetical protein